MTADDLNLFRYGPRPQRLTIVDFQPDWPIPTLDNWRLVGLIPARDTNDGWATAIFDQWPRM